MVKSKNRPIRRISFQEFKRLFILKLRNIDKFKLLDFIMNEDKWVKIEIN